MIDVTGGGNSLNGALTLTGGITADHVIAEGNQGGELVRRVLQTVDRNLPIKIVNAARSKQARADGSLR